MTKKVRLTEKQQRFVREYLVDFNGKEAAIRAGYSSKYAERSAYITMQKPEVMLAIQRELNKDLKKIEVTREMIINELALGGFYDIRDAFDEKGDLLSINKLPAHFAKAVVGIDVKEVIVDTERGPERTVTTKLKLMDKKGALYLLGQHLGMFGVNVNVKGKVEHEHKHIHASLSETHDFISQFTGGEADRPPKKSLPN